MNLQAKPTPAGLVRRVVTPPFIVAVAMLGAAAVLAGPVADWMQIKREKHPLPLRAQLSALNEDAIAPYRVLKRRVLEPIVVEALGTDMYLSWMLEDTSVPRNHPLRYADLFVPYDTGGHNLVPHTPDVCRLGAGYERAQPHENIEFDLDALKPKWGAVPARVCTFAKTGVFDRDTVSVVYTFHCNGKFVATRSGVRVMLNALPNTYAYFSKIEVSFPRATRAQCVEGAAKLLNRALPALLADHLPDFELAERQARRRVGGDR